MYDIDKKCHVGRFQIYSRPSKADKMEESFRMYISAPDVKFYNLNCGNIATSRREAFKCLIDDLKAGYVFRWVNVHKYAKKYWRSQIRERSRYFRNQRRIIISDMRSEFKELPNVMEVNNNV